jgi:hypothetical protein
MTRTVFFLILALVLVIAGAVGGAVGGTLSRKDGMKSIFISATPSGSSNSATTTSNGVTASTVTSASPSATASSATFGQIASSVLNNGTSSYPTFVFLYYQEGLNIMYMVYPGSGGVFGPPQILPLSMVPKPGTPLAATAHDPDDGTAAVRFPKTFDRPPSLILIYAE